MRRLNNPRRACGFTIIELLFAMSFVSIMLIVILTVTLQITRIYNKGITLKQVNQSGAAIAGDLQSSLKAADAPLSDATLASIPKGRLCLGTYSYVWNLKGSTTNKYAGSSDAIGLVKAADTDASLCKVTSGGGYIDVPQAGASELLDGSNGSTGVGLELRNMSVSQVTNSGTNYVYHVSFTVSTSSTGDNAGLIAASTDGTEACTGGPGDEFCALNRFDFDVYMRKGGSGRVD